MKTKTTIAAAALVCAAAFVQTPAASTNAVQPEKPTMKTDNNAPGEDAEWDKVFPKSDKVEHSKVSFRNRYGITLVADMYVPKAGNGEWGTGNGEEGTGNGKLPAIAVSGPFGAVKEQTSGVYAQHLAGRRGQGDDGIDPRRAARLHA